MVRAVSRPVYSMTGFARVAGRVMQQQHGAQVETANWALTIKSVNHRFLDLHLRLPGGTDALEMELRRRVKQSILRGHLELTLTFDRAAVSGQPGLAYDRELLAQYLAVFRAAQAEHGLTQEPDLNAALRMPGVFGAPAAVISAGDRGEGREAMLEPLSVSVLESFDALLDQLNTMREAEGKALAAVLHSTLDVVEQDVRAAAVLRARVQQAYLNRLRERIQAVLSMAADENRLLQESALLADRSDVEEEIARLLVHIEHFRSLLVAGGEVGKKLDFLLQEMNREANTLLSKSAGIPDEGARITELGLGMKSAIEKIREQVQNLE